MLALLAIVAVFTAVNGKFFYTIVMSYIDNVAPLSNHYKLTVVVSKISEVSDYCRL